MTHLTYLLQQNDFKHLAVQVFFDYFSQDTPKSQYLEWEKKDDNFE